MHASRSAALLASLVVLLAACTSGASQTPSVSVRPSPSAAASPPATASALASQGTLGPSPSSRAVSSPSATACPTPALDLELPSDRMVSVEVTPGATVDTIRFRFGAPSSDAGTSGTAPTVRIEAASPPYASDPAGLPLDVPGARVVLVRMQAMWLYDAAGKPTYVGPARFDEPGTGVRSVVRAGAFEGYETWLVGFDSGCLSAMLASDASLEVRVAH